MNQAAQLPGSPWLDDNRRLAWIAPLAVALWLSLLTVFAHLLSQTAPPPPQLNAVEARIVEFPAPAGLQSNPPAAPKAAVHRAAPHVAPRHIAHAVPAPLPAAAEGTAKRVPSSAPTASAQDEGATNLAGSGTDSSGARAIYSPSPEIPDDLREEPLDTVAVAHFAVSNDGQAQVTLTQPTPNPRLNDLLLATLKQWRFAPATRHGIAVESQFDIRIPVTIQ